MGGPEHKAFRECEEAPGAMNSGGFFLPRPEPQEHGTKGDAHRRAP